jgi:glycosyltransferase involved in cell wall biosynthesis
MKILMLCYEFPPLGGGGAKVVFGLSKELVRLGHEVDVVTMGFRGLPKHETLNGVNVYRVPCIRRKESLCTSIEMVSYLITAIPKVIQLIRQRNYDLNHTHFVFPDGVIALLAKRLTQLSYIITAHGSDVPGYNPHRFIWEHRFLFPLWNKVAQYASQITCPSENLKSLVLKHNSKLPIRVVPNGIDLDKFDPGRPKQKRVLGVTRMFERKGVQYILKAVEGLDLNHEIHIVGDGPYLETLRRLADDLKVDVKFWGQLDNALGPLIELYETSDIFILASEAENFPIVLLEAMAAGLAIITTQGTGCAEVIGDAGLLIEPRDPESLRNAVVRLAKDPALCGQLGRLARKRLETRFGWSAVADQYLDLYKSLKGRK